MKRKGNLYPEIYKFDHINNAFNEVCRNTKNKRKVANYKQYKCIYITRIYNTLKNNKDKFSFELAKNILSGEFGFICQYDRKTGADTVWSVIYDLKNNRIYRVEGNPSRKQFKEDTRMKFK